MRFEIRNATNQLEYQENINTKTDAFGMVNLVIGSGNQTGGQRLILMQFAGIPFRKN